MESKNDEGPAGAGPSQTGLQSASATTCCTSRCPWPSRSRPAGGTGFASIGQLHLDGVLATTAADGPHGPAGARDVDVQVGERGVRHAVRLLEARRDRHREPPAFVGDLGVQDTADAADRDIEVDVLRPTDEGGHVEASAESAKRRDGPKIAWATPSPTMDFGGQSSVPLCARTLREHFLSPLPLSPERLGKIDLDLARRRLALGRVRHEDPEGDRLGLGLGAGLLRRHGDFTRRLWSLGLCDRDRSHGQSSDSRNGCHQVLSQGGPPREHKGVDSRINPRRPGKFRVRVNDVIGGRRRGARRRRAASSSRAGRARPRRPARPRRRRRAAAAIRARPAGRVLAVALDVEVEVRGRRPGGEAVVLAQPVGLHLRDRRLGRLDRVQRDEVAEQVAALARPCVGALGRLGRRRLRHVGCRPRPRTGPTARRAPPPRRRGRRARRARRSRRPRARRRRRRARARRRRGGTARRRARGRARTARRRSIAGRTDGPGRSSGTARQPGETRGPREPPRRGFRAGGRCYRGRRSCAPNRTGSPRRRSRAGCRGSTSRRCGWTSSSAGRS